MLSYHLCNDIQNGNVHTAREAQIGMGLRRAAARGEAVSVAGIKSNPNKISTKILVYRQLAVGQPQRHKLVRAGWGGDGAPGSGWRSQRS